MKGGGARPYNGFEVSDLKLRATLRRMLDMCPLAWYIFIRSIQLSCALLLGALLLLIAWDGDMLQHYALYRSAIALSECAQVVLLVGMLLLPVIIEDVQGGERPRGPSGR